MNKSRRVFIKTISFAATAVAVADGMFGMISCTAGRYASFEIIQNRIRVKKSEVSQERFFMLRPDTLPAPIYVQRSEENEYSAVLLRCTHRGCEVNPAGNILLCPCHGSEYSVTGEVLHPPAEKNLKRFAVTSDTEFIYVEIR